MDTECRGACPLCCRGAQFEWRSAELHDPPPAAVCGSTRLGKGACRLARAALRGQASPMPCAKRWTLSAAHIRRRRKLFGDDAAVRKGLLQVFVRVKPVARKLARCMAIEKEGLVKATW